MNGEIFKLNYPEVVADNYRYRGAMENNDALKRDGGTRYQFGLDSKWGTTWRPIRVFAFFRVCTEVNAYLAMKYFLKTDDKFMDYLKKVPKELIKNSYTNKKACGSPENDRKRKLSHILETAPTHTTE